MKLMNDIDVGQTKLIFTQVLLIIHHFLSKLRGLNTNNLYF